MKRKNNDYETTGYRTRTGSAITVHYLEAEKVLGRPLPLNVIVHHADGDRHNNKRSNLVICPNNAYHKLLHKRIKAKAATGNPNFRRCTFCKSWDDPTKPEFTELENGGCYHKACAVEYKWSHM